MNETTLKTGYRCVYARIVDGLLEYDVRTSYPIDGSSLYDEILKDVFAPLYGIHV